MAFLALEFVPATLRPGREELLEGLLVGGQVLLEAVHRLFVTLTGLLPAEAAAGHGASTGHRPIDNGELVGIQDGLAAIFLKLVVAAVMSPAAPVCGIHREPFAPKPTVAAISVIGEEGAAPCDVFDHPLELPETAEGGGCPVEDEDKEDGNALHSRGDQEVHGSGISPSFASLAPTEWLR